MTIHCGHSPGFHNETLIGGELNAQGGIGWGMFDVGWRMFDVVGLHMGCELWVMNLGLTCGKLAAYFFPEGAGVVSLAVEFTFSTEATD